MVVKKGDEYHGIESVKKSQKKINKGTYIYPLYGFLLRVKRPYHALMLEMEAAYNLPDSSIIKQLSPFWLHLSNVNHWPWNDMNHEILIG